MRQCNIAARLLDATFQVIDILDLGNPRRYQAEYDALARGKKRRGSKETALALSYSKKYTLNLIALKIFSMIGSSLALGLTQGDPFLLQLFQNLAPL